ncbi:hypothetical protein A0H81_04184 [Grifola frondosa]|uniref:Uncharacterized protein n=1 Tax=Grifola frondosa TaxID=5627 RepID=A0A1C7MF76_GRIFR|nr:hypothetical protein A0H81_04184 [Grifola frondosa]
MLHGQLRRGLCAKRYCRATPNIESDTGAIIIPPRPLSRCNLQHVGEYHIHCDTAAVSKHCSVEHLFLTEALAVAIRNDARQSVDFVAFADRRWLAVVACDKVAESGIHVRFTLCCVAEKRL